MELKQGTKVFAISKIMALSEQLDFREIDSLIKKVYRADISSDFDEITGIASDIYLSRLEEVSPVTYKLVCDYLVQVSQNFTAIHKTGNFAA